MFPLHAHMGTWAVWFVDGALNIYIDCKGVQARVDVPRIIHKTHRFKTSTYRLAKLYRRIDYRVYYRVYTFIIKPNCRYFKQKGSQ